MGEPESVVQKFRLALVAVVVAVTLVLNGCASDDECDSNAAECAASVVAGQSEVAENNTDRVNDSEPVTVADINTVIVVTGQSNVEAADTDLGFDATLDQPHPRAFAFTDVGWQIADLHQVWDEHAHPGNHSLTVPGRQPNNSFVFHFAKSLAALDPNAVPAFIVLAAPGLGISNWDYESGFYWKIRTKVTDALAQLPNKDTIDVMLWHQGENDWLYEGTSDINATEYLDPDSDEYRNYYPLKLRSFINNIRSEPWAASDMPFICGETRLAEGVNRRLMALNDDGDPNSACVRAADLPFRLTDPSGAHFSAAGLRELGRRYMQQYLAIINQ